MAIHKLLLAGAVFLRNRYKTRRTPFRPLAAGCFDPFSRIFPKKDQFPCASSHQGHGNRRFNAFYFLQSRRPEQSRLKWIFFDPFSQKTCFQDQPRPDRRNLTSSLVPDCTGTCPCWPSRIRWPLSGSSRCMPCSGYSFRPRSAYHRPK